ncbi:hypothetical protein [Rugamonas apoptosis]|uniref:Uncharacterized protein n=1 Tax=Rugamonas apoptosis TaxID=2758570 RepID=A0A7W2F738_9BURK|nr:hypothetical protein [Rugamonas apoptosis]MBA5686336.1 hypothetical protein [Rugamonas apoptosis]
MKHILLLVTMLALTEVAAASDTLPAQSLRKQFVNSCVARAIERQDDAASAATFCDCTFDVLAKNLTVSEYIELEKASEEKRSPGTLPALARIKPKLAQCKR